MTRPALLATLLAGAAPLTTSASPPAPEKACTDESEWTDPTRAFRIFGNTWFVGTCGLSAILIKSPQGHVLIDAPMEENVPAIEANIRAAGARLQDVRAIVFSHAHYDHIGGLARLARDTGARVYGRGSDAETVEAGHSLPGDPLLKESKGFPAVPAVSRIVPGKPMRIAGLVLTPVVTSGHTPGSTSWTWRSCEGRRCVQMAYVDSLTAISDEGYRFSDEAAHPGYLAQFKASISRIGALRCEILLTPHPSASGMWQRFGPTASQPAIDQNACKALSARAAARLDERIARERAGQP